MLFEYVQSRLDSDLWLTSDRHDKTVRTIGSRAQKSHRPYFLAINQDISKRRGDFSNRSAFVLRPVMTWSTNARH